MSNDEKRRSHAARQLSMDFRDFHLGHYVCELDESTRPEPHEFMRFVAQNRPFIIRRYRRADPTLSNQDLLHIMIDKMVTLSVTPDGWADAVVEYQNQTVFMLPHEELVPFSTALDAIKNNGKGGSISYLQAQNDCLRTEYKELLDINPATQLDADIDWATKGLGYGPDSVNLWIGTQHSKTSLHKDSYENLYLVMRGKKKFRLYPPADCLRFPQSFYPAYRWRSDLSSGAEDCENQVPWYPQYPNIELLDGKSDAFMVVLEPGDMLYLPALWYHAVEQEEDEHGLCIAVNYWYDMFSLDKQYYMTALQRLDGSSLHGQSS